MDPTVLIELSRANAPSETRALLQGCESALGAGNCTVATRTEAGGALPGEGQSSAEYKARVKVESGGRQWVLLLTQKRRGGRDLSKRTLTFSEEDTPEQRWTAAGLVVAALVRDHRAELARQRSPSRRHPAPAAVAPASATPAAPSPPPESEFGLLPGPLHLLVSAEFLGGPGFTPGPPRLGGELGVGVTWTTFPLFPRLGISYQEGSGDFGASWLQGAFGAGLRLVEWSSPLGAELHVEGLLEQTRLRALRAGRRDGATRLRLGGRLRALGTWRVLPFLELLAGLSLAARGPSVAVEVAGVPAGSADILGWEGSAGLRATF